MERKEAFETLKEIVLDYLGDDNIDVTEDSTLDEDLGLSSLDMISIVGDVEDSFGISVEDDDVADIQTVGDVLDYVMDRVEA